MLLLRASSALMVLAVQRGPVSGQLLDIVVDRAPQLLAVAAIGAALIDQVIAQPVELGQICSNVRSARLFIAFVRWTASRAL